MFLPRTIIPSFLLKLVFDFIQRMSIGGLNIFGELKLIHRLDLQQKGRLRLDKLQKKARIKKQENKPTETKNKTMLDILLFSLFLP